MNTKAAKYMGAAMLLGIAVTGIAGHAEASAMLTVAFVINEGNIMRWGGR